MSGLPAMSKPASGPRSNPSESGLISVPAFAGRWIQSRSGLGATSSAYSSVAVGFVAENDEDVYAEPTTVTSAGVSFVSVLSRLPSSGLRRMLSSASLVTRILSTVGLKSTPRALR